MPSLSPMSPVASPESDYKVVRQVPADDIARIELLIRRYNNRLLRVARGLINEHDESMDVVQGSWIVAYHSLESF